MAATFENLAGDIARGHGEHVTALATLLGVQTGYQKMIFTMVQERYRKFLDRGEISPSALIKVLDEAMAGHPIFAKAKRCISARNSTDIPEAQLIFL